MKYLILYGMHKNTSGQLMPLYDEARKLDRCAIILFEDAILEAIRSYSREDHSSVTQLQAILKLNIPVYCIQEDLEARGFGSQHLLDGIRTISYLDSMTLIEQAEKLISWL